MKFAHLSDCHLGGWRQPELQELNLKAFQKAIEESVEEKVAILSFLQEICLTQHFRQ
jgi:DNA repair exonuclease SbcCD nuclease subunit